MSKLVDYIAQFQKYLVADGVDAVPSQDDYLSLLYAFYEANTDISSAGAGKVFNRLCDPKENLGINGVFDNAEKDITEVTVPVVTRSKPELINRIKSTIEIVEKIKKGESPGSELRDLFDRSEPFVDADGTQHVKIVLISSVNENDVQNRKKLQADLVRAFIPKKKKGYSVELVFPSDLLDYCEQAGAPEFVEKATIRIEADNILTFGKEKSLVVNLWASSLKQLFLDYGKKGLFEQNLRYYVKNKDVDSPIVESVKTRREVFWYLNNGITIICDSYEISPDRSEIELRDFSIINGCQTTSLLGTAIEGDSFESNDFCLLCKIVCAGTQAKEDKVDFISAIAEAANRQKKIEDRDLIANKPEQRRLKRLLADNGIFYQLKRGEKSDDQYPEPWQKTNSAEIGQLLLSAELQMPGPARANKSTIFKQRYDTLFKTEHKFPLYRDLLLLKSFYDKWNAEEAAREEPRKIIEEDEDTETDESSAAADLAKKKALRINGCLEMIAAFTAFARLSLYEDARRLRCTDDATYRANLTVPRFNLERGLFFNRKTVSEKDRAILCRECSRVFSRLLDNCILPAYKARLRDNDGTNATNFLKTDSSHLRILEKLSIYFGQDESYKIFEPDGMQLREARTEDRIADALCQLRFKKLKPKKTYKKVRKLAYTNEQAERIARNAEDLLDDRDGLILAEKCGFDSKQIDFWWKDIKKILRASIS